MEKECRIRKMPRVSSMPENALQAVEIDYTLPVAEISPLLTKLVSEKVEDFEQTVMNENKKTGLEVQIAVKTRHWNTAYSIRTIYGVCLP